MRNPLPLLPALLLFSCSHGGPLPPPPETPAPSAAAPAVELRALERKRIAPLKSQHVFELRWSGKTVRVGHGAWKVSEEDPDWNRMYGFGPVIWVESKGAAPRVLDLRRDFPSHYVSHVFEGEESGRILVFLDYGVEGPAMAYKLWISEDGGEHWFAGADLERPPGTFPPSELEGFYLDSGGRGSAWLRLEAVDLSTREGPEGVAPSAGVYYVVRTENGGRSWVSEPSPRFSSVVQPARRER